MKAYRLKFWPTNNNNLRKTSIKMMWRLINSNTCRLRVNSVNGFCGLWATKLVGLITIMSNGLDHIIPSTSEHVNLSPLLLLVGSCELLCMIIEQWFGPAYRHAVGVGMVKCLEGILCILGFDEMYMYISLNVVTVLPPVLKRFDLEQLGQTLPQHPLITLRRKVLLLHQTRIRHPYRRN